MKSLLSIVFTFAIAAGCSATTPGTSTNPVSTPTSTDIVPEAAPPGETPSPDDGPVQAKLGQTIRITCDGADCLDVTVLKSQTAAKYRDPQGYSDDVPDHKGDVFIAIQVRYVAVGANASYNPYDWALYVGDEQVQDMAFASNGPTPELGSNDLPKGKKVTGWILWEVPKTGKITIAYEPSSSGSIFEVVLRSK